MHDHLLKSGVGVEVVNTSLVDKDGTLYWIDAPMLVMLRQL